ncbi:MAG: hypothetical protein ABF289_06705 [Clostridiales bacterium]
MDINDFKNISLSGRVAYGICCFENILIELNYNFDDWKMVVQTLWEFTSIEYLDDWSDKLAEIIPDNLLEFKTYEEHDFEYLNRNNFKYLYNLYQNISDKIDYAMTAIFNIGTSHAYTVIVGYGQKSFDELEKLISFMINNNLPLPDITSFLKYSINENKGWGNKFDGTILSKIL